MGRSTASGKSTGAIPRQEKINKRLRRFVTLAAEI
jgi:hypothetical protein